MIFEFAKGKFEENSWESVCSLFRVYAHNANEDLTLSVSYLADGRTRVEVQAQKKTIVAFNKMAPIDVLMKNYGAVKVAEPLDSRPTPNEPERRI